MHNPKGIKFLTRPRLGIFVKINLNSFQDIPNTIFRSSNNIEIAINHLLHCSNYCNRRLTIMNKLRSTDSQISKESDSQIIQILLFCKSSLNAKEITSLFNAAIEFILTTKQFHDAMI